MRVSRQSLAIHFQQQKRRQPKYISSKRLSFATKQLFSSLSSDAHAFLAHPPQFSRSRCLVSVQGQRKFPDLLPTVVVDYHRFKRLELRSRWGKLNTIVLLHMGHKMGYSAIDSPGSRIPIFSNLWLHQSQWHAFLPEDSPSDDFETGLLATTDVQTLPAANVTELLKALEVGWVGGTALLVEQPFPLLHHHQGHWLETIIPLWESMGRMKKQYTGNILLWGSQASDLSDWMKVTLNVALIPMGRKHGGPYGNMNFDLIDAEALKQIPTSLWIGFEKLMVVRNRFVRNDLDVGFEDTLSAREFSEAAFQSLALPVQHFGQSPGLPKTITLMSSFRSQESIENMDAVLGMLWRVASHIGWRVRPFVVDSHTPFSSHLAVMRRTGLLVGRHSHLLSNAIFLPPGALLFELIPYNVEWEGVTLLYKNLSLSADRVSYSSWQADDPRWAVYRNHQDANYKGWTAEQCHSRECLAAHERAGLVVDVATVERMLLDVTRKIYMKS